MTRTPDAWRRWGRSVNVWWQLLPLADTVRGGLACAMPAVLAAALHQPLWCWAGIAAFWSCLADSPGATRERRIAGGLAFAVCGALASGLGVAAQALPVVPAVLAGLVIFAAALLRAHSVELGTRALLVGTAGAVSAVFPVHGLAAAGGYAGYFLAGGVWAVLCNVAGPASDPLRAVRRARTAYLHAAAGYLDGMASERWAWGATTGPSRALLRKRLDALHAAVQTAIDRGAQAESLHAASAAGERSIARLASLESLLAAAPSPAGSPAPHRQVQQRLFALARSMERQARGRSTPESTAVAPGGVRPRLRFAWHQVCIDVIEELHRFANELASGQGVAGASSGGVGCEPASPGVIALARASWQRVRGADRWARYAARIAVATTIAVATARTFGIAQGHWLVITAIWVVQPTVSHTLKTVLLRLGGTALGAFVATGLEWLVPGRLLLGATIFPLAMGTLAARTITYLPYVLFLTPQFVLVAQLGATGGAPWGLAMSRMVNSVAGAAIGLVVSTLLWPEWERQRLRSALRAAAGATRHYLSDSLARDPGAGTDADAGPRADLRRQACLAIDSAEAILVAIRLEPGGWRRRLERSALRIARWRRAIGAASLLEERNGLHLPELHRHLQLPGVDGRKRAAADEAAGIGRVDSRSPAATRAGPSLP